MACRCAPTLVALDDAVTAQFPDRDQRSDGCCGDPAHQARKSDHNPDASGYAHALDIDEDVIEGWGDQELAWFALALLDDDRVKFEIYERLIYYRDCRVHGRNCTGHTYTGVNPHDHHLHISIRAGTEKDMRPWPKVPGPTQEDDVAKVWIMGTKDGEPLYVVNEEMTAKRTIHTTSEEADLRTLWAEAGTVVLNGGKARYVSAALLGRIPG